MNKSNSSSARLPAVNNMPSGLDSKAVRNPVTRTPSRARPPALKSLGKSVTTSTNLPRGSTKEDLSLLTSPPPPPPIFSLIALAVPDFRIWVIDRRVINQLVMAEKTGPTPSAAVVDSPATAPPIAPKTSRPNPLVGDAMAAPRVAATVGTMFGVMLSPLALRASISVRMDRTASVPAWASSLSDFRSPSPKISAVLSSSSPRLPSALSKESTRVFDPSAAAPTESVTRLMFSSRTSSSLSSGKPTFSARVSMMRRNWSAAGPPAPIPRRFISAKAAPIGSSVFWKPMNLVRMAASFICGSPIAAYRDR